MPLNKETETNSILSSILLMRISLLPHKDYEFWFGLVWFYNTSNILGYLMPNQVYTYVWKKYMISKHIL